jgi:ribonuclease HI
MPWTYALLRDARVFARVREDGSFHVQGGRVEVRYKPHDGKAYFAAASNLVREKGAPIFEDTACSDAEAVAKGAKVATPRTSSQAGPTLRPKPGEWVAYADGACSGNPGPAGLGIVVIAPDGTIKQGNEYLGEGTNNVAELTAILRVLEATPKSAPLLVHTDSKYAIGVLSQGWKAKANQELVARIREALAARANVRLSYVPGHSGVPMNERADELAVEAVKTRRSRPIA